MSYNLPEVMSIEDRRKYFRAYQDMAIIFGEEAVDKELEKVRISDILEITKTPWNGNSGNIAPGRYQSETRKFLGESREHGQVPHPLNPEYTTTKMWKYDVYMGPAQYQSNAHMKMLTTMLLDKFPWLEAFKFDAYSLRGGGDPLNDEFYVRLSDTYNKHHNALYVPYRALIEMDASVIVERNQSYLKDYTKSDEAWNALKEDPITKQFLQAVEDNKPVNKSKGPKI